MIQNHSILPTLTDPALRLQTLAAKDVAPQSPHRVLENLCMLLTNTDSAHEVSEPQPSNKSVSQLPTKQHQIIVLANLLRETSPSLGTDHTCPGGIRDALHEEE